MGGGEQWITLAFRRIKQARIPAFTQSIGAEDHAPCTACAQQAAQYQRGKGQISQSLA
jgi:hypothetical protein